MNAIDRLEKELTNAGRLSKRGGFDASQARALVDGLRGIGARLDALEKAAAVRECERFSSADRAQARIAQLEAEIASLRVSEISAGLAKTLERGCAVQVPKAEQSPSLGCAVDHWRQ